MRCCKGLAARSVLLPLLCRCVDMRIRCSDALLDRGGGGSGCCSCAWSSSKVKISLEVVAVFCDFGVSLVVALKRRRESEDDCCCMVERGDLCEGLVRYAVFGAPANPIKSLPISSFVEISRCRR